MDLMGKSMQGMNLENVMRELQQSPGKEIFLHLKWDMVKPVHSH